MIKDLQVLYSYRDLLFTWINREIRVRYKQSLLGASWAILQPLMLMITFTLVFSALARIPTGDIPYPLFSYSAVLPWTFLATSISFGSTSLIQNMNLVTRTYFPREILPIGAMGASFIDFIIASAIFILMIVFYRVPISLTMAWLPLLLLLQMILTMGIMFLASSLAVFYRDIRFIIPLGLQIWFFATPIVYPVSLVPEGLRGLYMLNPMAGIITSYRLVIFEGQSPVLGHLGLSAVVATLLFFIGYRVFKRLEPSYADVI